MTHIVPVVKVCVSRAIEGHLPLYTRSGLKLVLNCFISGARKLLRRAC